MAPVVRQMRRCSEAIELQVCSTGQHREMLDQVLDIFAIKPDIDLRVMTPEQTPSSVAAGVLRALEPVLLAERPDWLLVQGDTTTVMAAAIAAHHLRIKVGHVEAGLRSHDKYNPFPEEMNRRIADHLSDLLFAPTARARENLLDEGIPEASIRVTGNTVIDALLEIAGQPWQPEAHSPLAALPENKRLILVTAHRRENFGAPLHSICAALREIAARDGVHIVYPVHLNPNVWQLVHERLDDVSNITLLPPLDYRSFVHLMKCAYLILTDSGGIQEEAPSLGIPVLVLRQVTERPEAVEAGVVRVVGVDAQGIVREVDRLLEDDVAYQRMARAVNPYGDGYGAGRIVAALLQYKG